MRHDRLSGSADGAGGDYGSQPRLLFWSSEHVNTSVVVANNPDEIARCYPVIRELRTHVATLEEFMERVARQQMQGYQLAYVEGDGEVRAIAGYRFIDNLFSGRVLYV